MRAATVALLLAACGADESGPRTKTFGEKSGFIAVTTGMTRADSAYLAGAHAPGDLPEGDYLSLEISDNGGGMPPEVLAKIFDRAHGSHRRGKRKWLTLPAS